MSSLTPYVYPPYPNMAAEDAERPYDPGPVQAVTPVAPVAPVREDGMGSTGTVADEADAVTISQAFRAVPESAARSRVAGRDSFVPAFDPVRDSERIRNNQAIRELIASLADYDNRAAQRRFDASVGVSVNYSPYAAAVTAEAAAAAPSRASDNMVYSTIGFTNPEITPRDVRERIGAAIDAWLRADGVFLPIMLNYASGDGFRFAPLSDAARAAGRSATVMASRERNRIAAYLREMARLTPRDFMFYDTTGLGALGLEERREFLRRVDALLEQAAIDERAAELRYQLDEENRLRLVLMDLDDERERIRLEELEDQISGYYADLIASVKNYGPGIISVSMAR